MAQSIIRDDAGARAARPALLLRHAMAHRSGARRGERNPVSRGRRWFRAVGRPGWRQAAAAEGGRHPSASRQPPARHARRQRGASEAGAKSRITSIFTISENAGSGERLDLLCGHFAIAPPHDRLLRSYLPPRLVVHAGAHVGQKETAAQLAGLVSLMRSESADDHLGGGAMLNALSTAMFALVLRLASETEDAPTRSPCARRSSPPCTGGGRPLQRTCASMVAAGACAAVQHVAGNPRPPVPGEARTIGQRSSDRHPDDARSERTEEIVPLHRRRCGGGRIPIRSGLPARLQEPHGRDPRAVAQNAGAVRPGRLRKACSPRRCEAGEETGGGSSCQTQASEGWRCALAGLAKRQTEIPVRPPLLPRRLGSPCSRVRRRRRRSSGRSG